MRCFFHLVNADRSLRDEEGVEVADLHEARSEVRKAITELRQADALLAKDWQGWRIDVSNESGDVLFSIHLSGRGA
jgi:hypothetical protein